MNDHWLEYYKINPTFIVTWRQLTDRHTNNRYNFHDPATPKEKNITYQGEMTNHSRRRLNKAIQLLLDITEPRWIFNPVTNKRQKFHLAFWTLTLSSAQYFTPDHDVKQNILEPFLRQMRKKGLKNYIWKAEIQQNGNIHFHLLTDFFLPFTVIRDTWNNNQSRLGYIDEFERRFGHRDPNSTDVRAVKTTKGIASYLSKYLLKPTKKGVQQKLSAEEAQKRKGKTWDCSLNLKTRNDQYDFLTDKLYSILRQLESNKTIKAKHEEFFKLFFIDKTQRTKLIPPEYLESYNNFINDVKSA